MTRSNHLWPDPDPEVEWEVWSEDTFDRETPPMREARGKGLVNGVKALWIRYLLETVRPEGFEGFTRFHLRRPPATSILINGPWEGAVRLRNWIFGTKTRSHRDHLRAADRPLFEAISQIHTQLLRQESTSEPILTMAAEASDRREFSTRLEDMARSWGIALDQESLREAPSLEGLEELEDPKIREIPSYTAPGVKKRRKRRVLPVSWQKRVRIVDLRLLLAIALLLFGLFFLAIAGRHYRLNCTRIESNLVECVHYGRWLGIITYKEKPVEGLWRARVGQICNSDGCVSFPELETAGGPVKLYDGSSGSSDPETIIVEKINAYLGDPGAHELEITIDIDLVNLILPLALILGSFVLFGVWLLNLNRQRK